MIDSAEESIFVNERFSARLSLLETQRLMAHRRHFLIKPVINLFTPRERKPRTVMNRTIKPLPSILDD